MSTSAVNDTSRRIEKWGLLLPQLLDVAAFLVMQVYADLFFLWKIFLSVKQLSKILLHRNKPEQKRQDPLTCCCHTKVKTACTVVSICPTLWKIT